MEDISDVLATKRWWRFRTTPSMWANFLKNKYCIRAHPAAKQWASDNSHSWKYLTKVRKNAEFHMVWQINSENCSFRWDNWSSKGSLANLAPGTYKNLKILVKYFIQNGEWNINKVHDILPSSMVQHIMEIEIGRSTSPDKIYWDLTQDGTYSNKSAMQIIRSSTPKEQLLSKGKEVNAVHKLVIQIAPIIICWIIWKERCPCKYGNQKKFNLLKMEQQVLWIIRAAVSKAFPSCNISLPWAMYCDTMLQLQPVQKITIVIWNKPEKGSLKLNTDESFIKENGKAGMGGILRDDKGDLIMAFSVSTQGKSNNYIEAQATWFGINWCVQNGYTDFCLELDSLIVANMLKEKRANNYKMNNLIESTSQMLDEANVNTLHCYREANQVTDYLAKLASSTNIESYFFTFQQLPKGAKGPFQLDKSQMLSVRTKFDKANFFVS
ncbi:uncharacterized protein [Nicotiana tomentosiformis]|uniref:uncharacterized protein n=1 Tax=Nicotiana tomentosiformis TaxID=4098 RepID=UPI00388CB9D0